MCGLGGGDNEDVTPVGVPIPSGEILVSTRRFPVIMSAFTRHTLRNTSDARAALEDPPFVQHHHRGAREHVAFELRMPHVCSDN